MKAEEGRTMKALIAALSTWGLSFDWVPGANTTTGAAVDVPDDIVTKSSSSCSKSDFSDEPQVIPQRDMCHT
jgi:hypothetical protein